MNKPKVIFIVGGLPLGGVEILLLQTVLRLKELGHSPIVINLSGTGELDDKYREAGVITLNVCEGTKGLKTTRFDTTRKLRQVLKKLQPDLIHTAHFTANYHARLATIGLGVPVITHIHNTKREKKFSRRLADRLLSFCTDMYLAVAKDVERQGVAPYNWAKRPCKVLYNAINPTDLEKANEVPLNGMALENGPVLFSVCRLVTQKNMDLLIQSVASIKDSIPNVSLLIIGDGPERKRLENFAEHLGITDRTFFAGFRQDVPGIMKSLAKRNSLFVLPSAFEGFGIAPLEGLYFGIPAVISPYVPILEIASKAVAVVEPNPDQMGTLLSFLLKNDAKLSKMSQEAVGIATKYSIEHYVDTLLYIYKEVLK